MKLSRSAVIAIMLGMGSLPARADCQFSPFSFFPDRNDQVQIKVTTQTGQSCAMAFKEGPGYHFTSALVLDPAAAWCPGKDRQDEFRLSPF
jgi:hypothetical protein